MATEELVAPAPAEAPEAAAPVADDSYNESLLIKIKGKVKKPTRPDDTERNLQVQKLQEQIDKASARMKEIKDILDSRATGKGVNPEQQALRDRIQQLRTEFDTVLLQKKRLQSQSDDKKTDRDKLIAEQRSIRDTIRGPSSLQAIEQALQEMEFKLNHESLSDREEKMMRERKERMERQDKPAAQRLAQVSAKIDEVKAANEAIRAEIGTFNTRLDSIKAAREAESAKLEALRAEQAEARSDIPGLIVEKKELWEVIQALRDKQREIRTAFNEKWEEFKKQDKAWKGWFAQERKKRQEQRKSEYEARQAARKAMDDSNRPAKFEVEVYTCEQVLSYLRQFVSAEKSTGSEEKKEVEAPAPGMKLLSKKADSDADSLFTGMGGKKGKGARKAAEKAQKGVDAVKKLPQVLPLETLKTFMSLGVEPPKANDDVPKAIEALEAKKKEFEEKRDKAAAEPPSEEEEEPEEEQEAAAEEQAEAATENGNTAAAEDTAAPEENGSAEESAAESAAEPAAEPAANGDVKPETAATEPEANGNTKEAEKEEEAKPEEAPDVVEEAKGDQQEETVKEAEAKQEEEPSKTEGPIKLRVTDDGEVKMEVQA